MTAPSTNNEAAGEKQLVLNLAARAKTASRILGQSDIAGRNRALTYFAEMITDRQAEILAANKKDMAAADEKDPLTKRLGLDDKKLSAVIDGLKALIALDDPLNRVDMARELDSELNLYRVTCPIGVVAVIFEARPDALPQIASLCIKSGNAVILKGGKEAEATNRVLFDCLQKALTKSGLPADCAHLLSSREAVQALLQADKYVDLIIPRGSNSLVTYVQDNTRIPVLGHAEGICHIYVDSTANGDKAKAVVVDAKVNYPAACNALETLLIHKDVETRVIIDIVSGLKAKGVEVKADETIGTLCRERSIGTSPAQATDWSTEYCDMTISVKSVSGLDEAIEHINQYGSGHTDGIICESDSAWQQFFTGVNSAGVFRNASTRFADGFRYGFGAEVGISTNKMHPRGPVGIEGLVTYKYKLEGNGQTVEDYSNGKKSFTHRELPRG
ncbi:MAG: glutamate-5-semialdehyde dehydrogenase [Cyanobacteria bacterium SZAS LIN-2]|nr:glutamate-5-semialdehyde dehydrogenase [Cyanobacteria bacterium SZAS LIN-2]